MLAHLKTLQNTDENQINPCFKVFPNIKIVITLPSQHLGRVRSCEACHFMVTKNTFEYLALDVWISNKKVITWLGPQPLESDWPGLGNCFWPWSPCGKHVSPVYFINVPKVASLQVFSRVSRILECLPCRYLLGVQLSVVPILLGLLVVAGLCQAILFNPKWERIFKSTFLSPQIITPSLMISIQYLPSLNLSGLHGDQDIPQSHPGLPRGWSLWPQSRWCIKF